MSKQDGKELSGLAKLAYKPFGVAFGLLGGLLAGRVFGVSRPAHQSTGSIAASRRSSSRHTA